jgi:hypothetical protein
MRAQLGLDLAGIRQITIEGGVLSPVGGRWYHAPMQVADYYECVHTANRHV